MLRRGNTNEDIVRNYFNATGDERKIYNGGINSSVSFCGDELKSYNMIICMKTKSGDYVINADKYSVTTSCHQSLAIYHSPNNTPQIPFSALNSGNINSGDIQFIDKTLDTYEYFERETKEDIWIKIDGVKNDIIYGEVWKREKPELRRYIHSLGACLFQVAHKYYLSSMDGNQYYLIELNPDFRGYTVKECYRYISGLSFGDYEKYLDGEIIRQGEFFFKPTDRNIKSLKKDGGIFFKNFDIQKYFNPKNIGNQHKARDVIINIEKNELYARGSIRHPQHRMINLKEAWHYVDINNVSHSWTASGNVD